MDDSVEELHDQVISIQQQEVVDNKPDDLVSSFAFLWTECLQCTKCILQVSQDVYLVCHQHRKHGCISCENCDENRCLPTPHIQIVHEQRLNFCGDCEYHVEKKHNSKDHCESGHGRLPYYCEECWYPVEKLKAEELHHCYVHETVPFLCSNCGFLVEKFMAMKLPYR